MVRTRSTEREQDRPWAINTTVKVERQDEGNGTTISPGNRPARRDNGTQTTLIGAAPPMTNKERQDVKVVNWRDQMRFNRKRFADLPQPETEVVALDSETVVADDSDDLRVAMPPARKPSHHDHGPWTYSSARPVETGRRDTAATIERNIADLRINSLERASIDYAHALLAKEHDRQIVDLGEKIYKSFSAAPTMNNASFESETDDSDFSEDLDVPLSPGLIRMQRWLQMSKRVQNLLIFFMLITVACTYFEQREATRLMVLLTVLTVPSWLLVLALAERERRERITFGKLLRSGSLYLRGDKPRPRFWEM